jgi:hypothetical protein
MAITSKEIIGDITDHIRKFGGDFAAWSVAIARDCHDPVFESRQSEAIVIFNGSRRGQAFRDAARSATARPD